jgi:hypothetical protein
MANEFIVRKGLIVEGASGGTVVDVQGSQGQLFSVTDDLSGSIFAVSDISGVPIFDVNSSGVSYFDGNVGIGATAPAYKLDVDGDIRAKENIRVFGNSISPPTYNTPTETSVNLGTYINDYAYIDLASTNAGGGWFDFSKGDGNDYAGRIRYVNSSDQFQISTAGSQKMVIESSGNVGIGTTNPSHKLDVYTNTDNGYVASFSQDNATGWGVLIDTDGVSNNDPALWVKNATSTVLWAAQSGNVGIGTTSPVANLHVNSSTTESVLQLTTSTSGALISDGLRIAMIGNVAAFLLRESADMWFATSNTERLRITSTGNVGIGTTDPIGNLNINGGTGDAVAQDSVLNLTRTSSTGNVYSAKLRLVEGTSTTHGDLRFQVKTTASSAEDPSYYTDAIAIKGNTANVGIGTTSPDNKLDVVVSDVNITPNAESSAVFRRNGNNYLTILTGSTNQGGILFGNAADANDGSISYTHSTQTMAFTTADTEKMLITPAGDVLVGKTAVGVGTDGVELRANGILSASRTGTSSNNVAYFNRNPDGGGNYGDGAVIQLRKDNVVVGVLGTEKWGIGTANPLKALHVVGDAQVTGAFYDSTVSAGTSGQVLSSTVTGTAWVAAGGGGSGTVTQVSASIDGDALDVTVTDDTTTPDVAFTFNGDATTYIQGNGVLNDFPVIPVVYTPDVWQLSNPQTISNSTTIYRSNFEDTRLISGTTASEKVSGVNNQIKVTAAGTYEISFDACLQTAYSVRQIILGYVEINDGIAQGSGMSNYLRTTGDNQGGVSSVSNTFYCVLAANDILKFAFQQIGPATFTGMQSVTIKDAISGLASAFSIRRIA